MIFMALALALLGRSPVEPAAFAAPDVWLAFAGDIAADDAARLRPVTGPIAQADLAIHVSSPGAMTPRALLAEIGFDAFVVDDDVTVTRHDLGAACVVILGGPSDRIGTRLDEVAAGPCFVVAVARWAAVGKDGLPPRPERARAVALVARGADLVVGHHPGAFAGVGWKGKTPIVWSVGSFVAPGVVDTGVFRARLASGPDGLALAELDMKPLVHDAAKARLRTPKEKEIDAIAAAASQRSRAVGGRAALEAAHIVFRPL